MSDKNNLSIPERANLLFKLGMPAGTTPTPDAKEALRILDSLQRYRPKIHPTEGGWYSDNPVTRINTRLQNTNKGKSLSFQSNDSSYNRPKKRSTKTQQLGIRATVNQMLDKIPAARISRELDNRYTFQAIDDDILDMRFKDEPGKPNARAKAYDRFTKGAFKAYPYKQKVSDFKYAEVQKGYGNRIKEDTWQPRTQGGKYGKYVKFDPTDVVKRLGKAAAKTSMSYVPQVGPAMQSLMIGDQLIEELTGTSPYKAFVEHTKKQFAKEDPKKPETWVPRPMTLMNR